MTSQLISETKVNTISKGLLKCDTFLKVPWHKSTSVKNSLCWQNMQLGEIWIDFDFFQRFVRSIGVFSTAAAGTRPTAP